MIVGTDWVRDIIRICSDEKQTFAGLP